MKKLLHLSVCIALYISTIGCGGASTEQAPSDADTATVGSPADEYPMAPGNSAPSDTVTEDPPPVIGPSNPGGAEEPVDSINAH
jgi:hypothetical protein